MTPLCPRRYVPVMSVPRYVRPEPSLTCDLRERACRRRGGLKLGEIRRDAAEKSGVCHVAHSWHTGRKCSMWNIGGGDRRADPLTVRSEGEIGVVSAAAPAAEAQFQSGFR